MDDTKSKKPDPVGVARELLADPKTVSRVLSDMLAQPDKILGAIQDTSFLHEPVYPDLVIHHEDEDFVFGFFSKGDSLDIACEMMICQSSVALGLPRNSIFPAAVAVWVGEGLMDHELRIVQPNVNYRCPLVDLREEFGSDTRLRPFQREVLGKLKTVHHAHGGLFRRLLELPPADHQHEFVSIAEALGYQALALRVVP